MILYGLGSGRMFAGLRLLEQQACTRIVHLNRARGLGSVKSTELRAGDGYLWDFTDQGMRPFQAREFEHTAQVVSGVRDCRLVIVVGDIGQVPRDVAAHGVGLTAPDAMVIAEAAVLEQDGTDAAAQVLHDEFAEKLSAGVSPGVALQAAALAIRVTNGELSAEVARQTLTEGVEKEVAERIDGS